MSLLLLFNAQGPTPADLSGQADGVGSATGALTAQPQLSGTAAGVGAVTNAKLTAASLMTGTAAGQGSVTANLTAAAKLTGQADGVGSAAAALTATPKLSGTAAGVGTATGALTAPSLMTGTAAGVGTATGSLTASSKLTGTAAGVGTATGNLTAASQLSGTAAGVGSVTAQLQQMASWLKDDFASTIDAKWIDINSNSSISSGKLSVPGTTFFPTWDGVITASDYKLTGSEVVVEVPQLASGSTGSIDTVFLARLGYSNDVNNGNEVRFTAESPNLLAQKCISGVATTIATVTYSATNHRWWRISESGGTVTFATSPDSVTWTTLTTITTATLGFNVDSVRIALLAGWYGSLAPTTPAQFDNVNLGLNPAFLSGTAAGVGSAAASLTATAQLSATAAGVGSASGALTAAAKMSGTAAGQGSVAANLTAPSLMTGSAAGIGTATGALTAAPKLTATAAGIGTASGALTATALLSGTAAGIGSVAATLSAATMLTGTAAGIGSIAANLTASSKMTGQADGVGSVSALLTASPKLTGTAAGIGSVVGNLTVPGAAFLSGTGAGIGTAVGALTAASKLTGSAAGIGTASAALTASPQLSATAAGIGTASGSMKTTPQLSGQADGIGTASGTLKVAVKLTGTAAGIGSATGSLITVVTPGALETLVATIVASHTTATITADGLTGVVIDPGVDVTIAVGHTDFVSEMTTSAPDGWWRYEETSGSTAATQTGLGSGTLGSGATFGGVGALARGPGGSVLFDGTANAYVSYGATGLTGDFSVEALVYVTGAGSIGSTDYNTIFGNSSGKRLLFNNQFGYVLSQFGPNLFTPNGSVTLNAWNHIAYTFDGVATARIYIGGILAATDTSAGGSVFTGAFSIGSYVVPSTNYTMLGRIDEPAVYNRALSADEVARHWFAAKDAFTDYGLRTAAVVDTIPDVTVTAPHDAATIDKPHNVAVIAHS